MSCSFEYGVFHNCRLVPLTLDVQWQLAEHECSLEIDYKVAPSLRYVCQGRSFVTSS